MVRRLAEARGTQRLIRCALFGNQGSAEGAVAPLREPPAAHCAAAAEHFRAAHFRRKRPILGNLARTLPTLAASEWIRTPRATPATIVGTHPYSGSSACSDAQRCGPDARGRGTAPIGAEMFETERRNHYRTGVYAALCDFLPVDRVGRADKLEKAENSLENERFDVFFHFLEAWLGLQAWIGELERSPAGPARAAGSSVPRSRNSSSPERPTPVLPAVRRDESGATPYPSGVAQHSSGTLASASRYASLEEAQIRGAAAPETLRFRSAFRFSGKGADRFNLGSRQAADRQAAREDWRDSAGVLRRGGAGFSEGAPRAAHRLQCFRELSEVDRGWARTSQ